MSDLVPPPDCSYVFPAANGRPGAAGNPHCLLCMSEIFCISEIKGFNQGGREK